MATYGTFVDGVSLKASEVNDFFGWKSFTPVVRQPGLIAVRTTYGRYCQVNKTVIFIGWAVLNDSGTANTRIECDLPVAAASSSIRVLGSGFVEDDSLNTIYRVTPVLYSTTRIAFLANVSTSLSTYVGQTGGPTLTLASNDVVTFNIRYEAA